VPGSTQPPASVTITLSGVPAAIRRNQSFNATAAVANTDDYELFSNLRSVRF